MACVCLLVKVLCYVLDVLSLNVHHAWLICILVHKALLAPVMSYLACVMIDYAYSACYRHK